MSLAERPPSAGRTEYRRWAERLNDFLTRTKSKLAFYVAGDSAEEDGTILWDRTGYPVISKNNEWRQIVLADGYGEFTQTGSLTATSANTAYAIPFNSVSANGGLSIDGSDNTKIRMAEAGVYNIAGHVQLKSSSAASKTVYYWLKVNGANLDHSERMTVHNNGAYGVLSVSDQIEVPANSYVQAYWAVSDTALWLDSDPATAFAPRSDAIHLTVTRNRQ